MRSLLLLSEVRAVVGTGAVAGNRSLVTIDPDTGSVYCAVTAEGGRSRVLKVEEVQGGGILNVDICSFPDPNGGAGVAAEGYNGRGSPSEIVGLQYLPDSQALCVALAGGDIVLVRTENADFGDVEVVGTVDSGIQCMEWSPDHEVVVMVTGFGTILEMTKDFDVIAEVPIHVEEKGEDTFVSLGWGKKETQFHGSAGKEAAVRKEPAPTNGFASPNDDLRPRLSWRGDGNFFVCSALDRDGEKRVLRVYNRECGLQSTSEVVAQLEHSLSWRPSGNLIASTQKLPHRHDVVFFERNGLRHGEFTLRQPGAKVVELAWNADSSILAVWTECWEDGRRLSAAVQLWSTNNYYWYLKQQINPADQNDYIAGFVWDPEVALRLHVMTEGGEYRRLEYCMDEFTTTSLCADNPATVAVIDGASLLLTPFKHLNTPPPMSALKATLPAPIAHVAFAGTGNGDDFAVLLCDGTVRLFRSHSGQKPVKLPETECTVSLYDADPSNQVTYRQLSWPAPGILMAISHDASTVTDSISIFSLSGSTLSLAGAVRVDAGVSRLYYSAALDSVFAELNYGRVLNLEKHGDAWTARHVGDFPVVCPWFAVAQIGSGDEKERVPIGLSNSNKLYANDRVLSTDCTSFFVHNNFLIFTTLTHVARFVPLNVGVEDFKFTESTASTYDEQSRRVERGAKIVIAVPSDIALVLQMPRGNLETIYPRALVLSTVRQALDRRDFRTAFILCRKHRIDMNILVDHDRDRFMDNVALFAKQVEDPEFLNLFVSGLRNEDVTVTMYAGSGQPRSPGDMSNKVNLVCKSMCAALQSMDARRYVQTILTTDAKQTPPDLETAMARIMEIKEKESPDAAESALKYLIFLADVDQLYDVALGMYDFALVLMVAQHSQKVRGRSCIQGEDLDLDSSSQDPREYLPFLSELQKLEPSYQRFKIDDLLEKKEKALLNLSLSGDAHYPACLTYIKQHDLFKPALKIFKELPEKHNDVLKIYAQNMEERGVFDEAGLLYAMAGEDRLAMDAYRQGLAWHEAFAIASQEGVETSEVQWMASEIADELIERRRFAEAARVLLDYGKAYMHGHADLVDSTIKPGILEGCNQLLDDIRELSETFEKQRERLREVRAEKARKRENAENGVPDDGLDDIDMFSDTSSMATTRITGSSATSRTGWTNRTGRSSKIRRKHERKRAAGKNPEFEEEFLVGSLRKIIVRSNSFRGDVLNLVRALAHHKYADEAQRLQTAAGELIAKVKTGMEGIFVLPTQAAETQEEYKMRILEGRPPPPPPVPKVEDLAPAIDDTAWGVSVFE
ncbi:hypothetical protein HK104_008357 [Borealophlyctis nickersoniae]|nr:hypothetical protein HK104_008357 [Borealophlyctis nickersoniae]